MSRSVSVLLPVRNAQSTLIDSVHQVLDIMTDYGHRFELVIIDDGSTDATSEVADELTRHYPQVRLVTHGRPLGDEEALRTGIAQSRGEVVMLRGNDGGFCVVHRRWQQGHGPQSSSRPGRPNYLERLKSFALGE